MRLNIFIATLFVCVLTGSSFGAAQQGQSPPNSAAVERARKKVLERASYQTDLPDGSQSGSEASSGNRTDLSWMSTLAPFASFLLRLLLAILLVGLVVFLVREFSGRPMKEKLGRSQNTESEHIRGEEFHINMSEIRHLADRGQFSQAIHALLLHTVHELCRLGNVEILSSMTSREIVEEIPLGENPRQDLSALVMATEVCHFGAKEATFADYDNCVQHFESFLRALGGQVA